MNKEEINLINAIESQSLEYVQYLLNLGYDPNYPETNLGFKPVHFAVLNLNPNILEELINKGAIIDESSSQTTTSILQLAIQVFPNYPEISLQMIHILTKDNRLTNRDVLGQALQYACGMGYHQVVQILLLNQQCDPNYYPSDDEYEMTPLIGMIFENEPLNGHIEVLQLLINSGVNLLHKSNLMTALDYAYSYGRNDLIPILESYNNNQNFQTLK